MSVRQNNAVIVDACTRRLNALSTYASPTTTIAINGKLLKLPAVLAIYQATLDARAALSTLRATAQAALQTRADAEAAHREADRALRSWVENHFGIGSKEAIDFGFPAAKKPTLTVEGKAAAVARAKATREARHTMGKKQKSGIKGTLAASTAPAEPAIHTPAGDSPASDVVTNGGS